MSDEKNHEVTAEEALQAQLEALQAENDALKAARSMAPPRKLTCKVSQKGGMSVYGLGRWPVTLYRSQWQFFLDNIDTVRKNLNDFAEAGVLVNKE